MQAHARQLRALLESLDDIRRSRAQLVARATRLAASEDITPRILKAASAIERWVEVQPGMFEDILDEEMVKYDKFRDEIEEGEQKQEVLLDSIKVS
jgi:programmed cell death 6-interacting protein